MPTFRKNPWLIAGMGLVILLITNGLTATAITVYDESLLDEFGWSRGQLKLRDLINFAIVAALAPASGWLLDRVGARRLLLVGMLLLSAGYFGYSRVAALWHVYAIHVVFAFALLMSGTMVVIVLVSSWFVARRGQAIGIALVGTSLGAIVISPFNAVLLDLMPWRSAFAVDALLPLAGFLLVLLFVRDSPAHVGGTPLGVAAGDADPRSQGLSFGEALRTRSFWAISVSGFLTYYSSLALFSHMFLHMRGLGYELKVASLGLSLLAALAMLGKVAAGALADRFDRHKVFMFAITLMLAGAAALATMRGGVFVWGAVAVVGLGWGGLFTLYNMLAVNNFGLKAIGKINGSVTVLESLGAGTGVWLTGRLFDLYGSYRVPFLVITGCVFAGLVIGAFIRNELRVRSHPGA